MITRIVKMTFRDDKRKSFEEIFDNTQDGILKFKGCLRLQLQRNTANPSIYFTISYWDSPEALENYRSSDFFRNTWSIVKPMFAERAEAWSLEHVSEASN